MKKAICILLISVLLLSVAACGTKSAQTDPNANITKVSDPYTPYEQTVTLTKGATVLGTGGLPSGDDFGNNVFTRYLKNTQNIDIEIAWSVDSSTYDSKVALCITSQTLPDILVVNRSVFKQLVENDLIADLTDAYNNCISPFLKSQFDSYGEELFEQVTVDGKLMGIPSPALSNCQNVLWIRKDWLEKTGLDAPKTLEDVENLAKTSAKRVTVHGDVFLGGLTDVRDVQRFEGGVTFLYGGEIKELLRILAAGRVTDISIAEPDLEEIFMHYYQDESQNAAALKGGEQNDTL